MPIILNNTLNNKLVLAKIIVKIYLVENFKAKILINNNIIILENLIINFRF